MLIKDLPLDHCLQMEHMGGFTSEINISSKYYALLTRVPVATFIIRNYHIHGAQETCSKSVAYFLLEV